MKKVKIFSAYDPIALEDDVNLWLSGNYSATVFEVQYRPVQSSDSVVRYTAMIIYKEMANGE